GALSRHARAPASQRPEAPGLRAIGRGAPPRRRLGEQQPRSPGDRSAAMQSASSSSSVLDVSGGNIGDDGAARVAEVLQQGRKLEEVRLDLNGISDAAIPQLARSLRGCPSLKKLSLRGNAICDDGAAVLAAALAGGRCTARELDLSQNAIGDKGAAALGEALEGNAALKRLHLADNAISDAGAVRLVKALGVNRTLADLDLEANRITPPVVEHLSEAARGLGKSVRRGDASTKGATVRDRRLLGLVRGSAAISLDVVRCTSQHIDPFHYQAFSPASGNFGKDKMRGEDDEQKGAKKALKQDHDVDMTTQGGAKLRLVKSTLLDTFTMPMEHPVLQELQKVTDKGKTAVATARCEDAEALWLLGRPAANLAVTHLEALTTCDIRGALKQDIQGYFANVQPPLGDATVTKTDLELDIQAVKVEPCFHATTRKFTMAAPR
ncbi:unnamed protein product, partial [Prorocentrum cordatum]